MRDLTKSVLKARYNQLKWLLAELSRLPKLKQLSVRRLGP